MKDEEYRPCTECEHLDRDNFCSVLAEVYGVVIEINPEEGCRLHEPLEATTNGKG